MDTIIRAAAVYLFLMLIFRLAGKRTMAQMTTFDLVLTLIISEAIQGALTDHDNSVTGAFLLVITLVGLDIVFSLLKIRFSRLERIIDGSPTVVLQEGKLLHDRMRAERIDESDILEAARELQGLSRLDQIRYAIVEKGGKISIVPKEA